MKHDRPSKMLSETFAADIKLASNLHTVAGSQFHIVIPKKWLFDAIVIIMPIQLSIHSQHEHEELTNSDVVKGMPPLSMHPNK